MQFKLPSAENAALSLHALWTASAKSALCRELGWGHRFITFFPIVALQALSPSPNASRMSWKIHLEDSGPRPTALIDRFYPIRMDSDLKQSRLRSQRILKDSDSDFDFGPKLSTTTATPTPLRLRLNKRCYILRRAL